MNQTMERLRKMEEQEYSILVRILFGLESPSLVSNKPADIEAEIGKIEFFDPTLNDSQKEAIIFALTSREVSLIHGPPGVSWTPFSSRERTDVDCIDGQDIHPHRTDIAIS